MIGGDAQIPAREGKPGAEEGEVGWVTPQSAARAVLRLRGIRRTEPGHVRAGEGVVDCQLEGSGRGTPRVFGLTCLTTHVVFLHFHCSVPAGPEGPRNTLS